MSIQAVNPRKTKASLHRDMHGRFLDLRSLDVGSKQGETLVSAAVTVNSSLLLITDPPFVTASPIGDHSGPTLVSHRS